MRFIRTNVAHAKTDKRSGDRVEIAALHSKSLPIVYASSLAEERVRHEISEADDNVYKKAFDVDVNVEMVGDRPVAYRIVGVHDVIDIVDPEEEEEEAVERSPSFQMITQTAKRILRLDDD